MGGLEAFKAHPWFAEYDWDKLERKEATPPFEPDVRVPVFRCPHAFGAELTLLARRRTCACAVQEGQL